MSINLSQQKREKLLNNIKIMREKLNENPELVKSLADIESELKRKKYGLIWEEHEEKVDEELKTKIPVFLEEKNLEIREAENKEAAEKVAEKTLKNSELEKIFLIHYFFYVLIV